MKRQISEKLYGWLLVILILLINFSPCVQNIKNYPESIILFEGETKKIPFSLPFFLQCDMENESVVNFKNASLKENHYSYASNPIHLKANQIGKTSINLKLLGFVSIKKINIFVSHEKQVIPGGEAIGVTLYTDGVLVVGISDFFDSEGNICCPAKLGEIKPGDVIKKVDGKMIKTISDLMYSIREGEEVSMELQRKGVAYQTTLTPIYDNQDNQFHLGIWVRDSTVGVGTLTYYDPADQSFAALGHGICDIDTGTMLSIKDGSVVKSEIIDVVQGIKGKPGELRGSFAVENESIGDITKNINTGLYGIANDKMKDKQNAELIPIQHPENVHIGEAKILSTVDDEGVKAFDIEIQRINLNAVDSGRGMIIKITDTYLINTTGGVVQGMSGSPIIQDNHLVGAVTHVFVNDPTKGYGIFAEWMLNNAQKEE